LSFNRKAVNLLNEEFLILDVENTIFILTRRGGGGAVHHLGDQRDREIVVVGGSNPPTGNFFSTDN